MVIAKGKEFAFQRDGIIDKVTKAYCVAVAIDGSEKGDAKIIPATYKQETFDAKVARFNKANAIKLNPKIIETAQLENPLNYEFVPLIEQKGENFVGYFRENCFRPSEK